MEAKNFRARVAQPNTPETDMQKYVKHLVKFEIDGETHEMEVTATDPLEAIEYARHIRILYGGQEQ